MADCHGRLTGKPGICFVTRGPGATNASAGIHIAMQDSIPDHPVHRPGRQPTPGSARRSRRSTTGGSSATSPNGWSRSTMPRAFPNSSPAPSRSRRPAAPARSSSSLPEDMLTEPGRGANRPAPYAGRNAAGRSRTRRAGNSCSARPSGPSSSSAAHAGTREAVARHAARSPKRWSLPVGCSFRRQMLFDHLHPNYAGDVGIGINPKLATAIKQADLVLLVGGRMGEMPSSDYTLLKSPYPDQTLVHVHPDAGELGRVYRPTLAINASPAAFVDAFAKRKPAAAPAWAAETPSAARRLSRLVDAAGKRPGCRPHGADHELSRKNAARRRHPHQWRRQLRHLGASLPPLPPLRHASSSDLRLDGLRHAGRGRRQAAVSRSRRSSPSPATAAS